MNLSKLKTEDLIKELEKRKIGVFSKDLYSFTWQPREKENRKLLAQESVGTSL